jgi:hypothetical protein
MFLQNGGSFYHTPGAPCHRDRIIGSHGRYGVSIRPCKFVLGNRYNDDHEISSSFSPARTGA